MDMVALLGLVLLGWGVFLLCLGLWMASRRRIIGPFTPLANTAQSDPQALLEAQWEQERQRRRAQMFNRLSANAPRVLMGFGALCLVLYALYLVGYVNGGRDRRRITFGGFTRTHYGLTLGTKKVYATAGQTVTVRYDVTARQGRLLLWLKRLHGGPLLLPVPAENPLWWRDPTNAGVREEKVRVPESGFYQIFISGVSDGKGYDITYDVSWKVL